MRILVADGGSEHSQIALRQFKLLAQKQPVTGTVLAVIKDEDERAHADAILRDAVGFLSATVSSPEDLQTKVRVGSPDEEIVEEALSGNYDLLIIGERPHHSLLTRLMGPTALRIIAQRPCPVLIAKEQPHPLQQILICNSIYAEPSVSVRFSLQFPEFIAQAKNVTVLHVMSQIAAAPGVPGQQLRADADELMTEHTREGEALTQDVQVLSEIDSAVEPIVRHGLVVEEILAEARDGHYDLVVIGAHPHEGWQHILLEDITSQIVLEADRPVLVMP